MGSRETLESGSLLPEGFRPERRAERKLRSPQSKDCCAQKSFWLITILSISTPCRAHKLMDSKIVIHVYIPPFPPLA